MAKKDELNFENGNNMAGSEKLKALQAAMDKIEKSFGKGSIMKMGDESVEQVEVIPTGSIGLNVALGVGGYPRGRIIEIYGPESSGKTTLAIHAIAEAQKAGGIAAFIDAEHAFDRFYAAKLGVDVDNLLISQPDNGEQALEIAEQLIRSSAIDIIVVDPPRDRQAQQFQPRVAVLVRIGVAVGEDRADLYASDTRLQIELHGERLGDKLFLRQVGEHFFRIDEDGVSAGRPLVGYAVFVEQVAQQFHLADAGVELFVFGIFVQSHGQRIHVAARHAAVGHVAFGTGSHSDLF